MKAGKELILFRFRALAAVLLAFTSTASMADWSPRFTSGAFQGTITFEGHQATVSEAMTGVDYSSGPLGILAQHVYALPNQARSQLDNEVKTLVSQSSGSGYNVSFIGSGISGGITMSLRGLTGAHTGWNQATLSGLSYTATVRGTGSQYGISFECDSTLAVNNVSMAITYEPYTGQVSSDSALSYAKLNPTASTHCSSSIDFIPLLGDVIDGWVGQKISSTVVNLLNGYASKAVDYVIPKGPDFLGLYAAVPHGKYKVSINGTQIDLGDYLHDNFSSLFTGRMLTVTMKPAIHVGTVKSTNEPPWVYTNNTIKVDFNDPNTALTFSVVDTQSYQWTWYCPPLTHTCGPQP